MKKFTTAVLLITVMTLTFFASTEKARAGVTDYTATWNATNLYDSYSFSMLFTGLDVTSNYRWSLSAVDNNGNPIRELGSHTNVLGSAATAFVFGPQVVSPYMGDWPDEGYTGPFMVSDNFGQIVMRGFVAPDPELTNGDWKNGIGFNAYVDKVIAGSPTHSGACRNPVYNNYFGGWNYDPREHCGSGVQNGTQGDPEYALMHFNLDCPTYVATGYTLESYRFYDYSGTEIFQVELDELVNYINGTGVPIGACTTPQNFESFVVVNTSPDSLPFIDNTRAQNIFTGGKNPHEWDFGLGAYYIQKRSAADAFVADGESPFFVTRGDQGIEWTIEIGSSNVSQNANLNMFFKQKTERIWDDYHGTYTCQNDAMTWIDNTVYSFVESRPYTNVVPGVVGPDFIECEYTPLSIGTTDMTTAAASVVIESNIYNVIAGNPTIDDSINQLIVGAKLNTDAGLNFVFLFVLLVSVLLVTAVPQLRTNKFAYLIAWTLSGGAWISGGPVTTFGVLAFLVSTAVLWILILGSDNNNDAGVSIE